jgi:predicted ATP-grasp superfamily ATP-dependent carboligase
MHKNKAVVLGANYYIGLSIIRCLGKHGIYVAAIDYSNDFTYGFDSKYLSEKLIGPHYKDKTREFIDFLIEYAKKQDEKPVLFPSADGYVEVVDEYMDELRKYYLFPKNEKGKMTELLNKQTLEELCRKTGVRVPETISTKLPNYIEKVEKLMDYPCLVKPSDSATFVATFRKKMFEVKSREELLEAVKKADEANLEVIVQRIIPGFDDHMYTFDVYCDENSNITHWTTCQKYRQYPINYGASVYTSQKYVPELYVIGNKFFKGVGWKGFAEIEFKKDAVTGEFYLIEVNVRISNLNELLRKVGLNMPYITYRDMIGSPIKPKAIEHDTNICFWYAYEDILAARGYIKTNQLKALDIFKSYHRPKAYAIWDPKDSKPFRRFVNHKLKRILKKIFKIVRK